MTTAQIKEQLSIHYLGVLVGRVGHRYGYPHLPASSVDAMITEVSQFTYKGKKRYAEMGYTIDVQIKSTIERKVKKVKNKDGANIIKFDLKVKNFNDLVFRNRTLKKRRVKPLLLVVVVLPNEKSNWIKLSIKDADPEKFLQIGGVAY